MKLLESLVALIVLVALGCGSSEEPKPAPAPPPIAAANPPADRGLVVIYHIDDVEASFLKIASKLDQGFTKDDAERLANATRLAKKGMSFKEEFEIAFKGKESKLIIEVENSSETDRLVRFVTEDAVLQAMIDENR